LRAETKKLLKAMSQEKKRIFISYKRVDKDRVFAIRDGIEQATGEKCWIDLEGIESNAQFVAKIMRAIDECEIFLFMRSKEHDNITNLGTDWTIREVNYALKKGKNIVFINLDNTHMPDWFEFMFPNKQETAATDHQSIIRLHDDIKKWLTINTYNNKHSTAKEERTQKEAEKLVIKKALEKLPYDEIIIDGYFKYKKEPLGAGLEVCEPIIKGTNIRTITIPDTILYNKVSIPITRIGNHAFHDFSGESGCNSLTSIYLPNSIKSIGDYAFLCCSSLTSITLPYNVISIGEGAFKGCSSLTSITIPNSVTSIGDWAFQSCSSLTSITIPNSVTSIGESAFQGCSSLTSIIIPNGIHSISNHTFSDCSSLTSITIPDSIIKIGTWAFHGCNSLTTITIPNSIRIIENWCFSVCTSLTTIHYNGSKRTWDAITKGKDWNAYVPAKVIHCINGDIKIGGLFDFFKEPLQFLKR